MAKFKKARRTTRQFGKMARRAARRTGVGNSGSLFQLDAMLYGAARQYTSNLIAPVTSKIPIGSLADEVGMGVLDYLIAKHTSGMISNVARKGLVIENARVGEAIVQGGPGVFTVSGATIASNAMLY